MPKQVVLQWSFEPADFAGTCITNVRRVEQCCTMHGSRPDVQVHKVHVAHMQALWTRRTTSPAALRRTAATAPALLLAHLWAHPLSLSLSVRRLHALREPLTLFLYSSETCTYQQSAQDETASVLKWGSGCNRFTDQRDVCEVQNLTLLLFIV